ncbi:hypothetical protein ACHAW6_012423 [Cyclotella cf. meneghiniana]
MNNKKKSPSISKNKSNTTKRKTSSDQKTIGDDHSASSISNDTFASRSYLRSSLASDPWNSTTPSAPQTQCQSSHDRTTPPRPPSSRPNRHSRKPPSSKTARKSRELHSSYVDLPQVRESMIESISNDVRNMIESDEDFREIRRKTPTTKEGCVDAPSRKKGDGTNTAGVMPPAQLLSSLGLDSSSRGHEERNRSLPPSLFGALWEQSSPTNDPVIDHYNDENICESGAMALVRCMNGDARFSPGDRIADNRPCYCIFKTMNVRLFLTCLLSVFIVVSLAVAVPLSLRRFGPLRQVENENNATASTSSGEWPIETSYIEATDGVVSESEKMSLAEEIIRVCKPNGYDEDREICRKHCNLKQCCFVHPDDERGNFNDQSGLTLASLNENAGDTGQVVQYCGDDPWEDCLIFAGCKPYFS